MKRLIILGVISTLMVMMLSLSLDAASSIKSSKSNTSDRELVYTANVVSQAQATAILTELDKLDKAGRTVGVGQVTEIIKKLGIPADRIKKISVPKRNLILLLEDPADEAQAIAVSDEGVPGHK